MAQAARTVAQGLSPRPQGWHPQILTGLTVGACVAIRALADVLGEDVSTVCVIDHLALRIIEAGVWETGTWGGQGREDGQVMSNEMGTETGSSSWTQPKSTLRPNSAHCLPPPNHPLPPSPTLPDGVWASQAPRSVVCR